MRPSGVGGLAKDFRPGYKHLREVRNGVDLLLPGQAGLDQHPLSSVESKFFDSRLEGVDLAKESGPGVAGVLRIGPCLLSVDVAATVDPLEEEVLVSTNNDSNPTGTIRPVRCPGPRNTGFDGDALVVLWHDDNFRAVRGAG